MHPTPTPVPLSEILARGWAESADRPAMIHNAIALDYTRVFADVERIAASLVERGIRPGDIVAVLIRKPVTHWMVTLGLMRLGAVSVTLTANARAELAALPEVSALLCGPGEEGGFPEVARRVAVDRHWLDRPVPASGLLPAAAAADRTVGRICFTSGTSGRPKAILLDAGRLAARLSGTARRAGLHRDTTLWCGLGPDTAYGFTATIATWLEGGTVVLSAGDRGAFGQMHARGVNTLIASPAALAPLIRDAAATGLPPLAGPAIVAGGRLSAGLRDRIRDHVCTAVQVAYGSSEAGGVTLGNADDLDIHPGRVGAVFADIEAVVVDARGAPVPPGTEGRLKIRSDSMVSGYLNDPEASAAVFEDGWFLPGDIATLSATGHLTLLGRTAQILNLGGVKIPVEELEHRISALDGVEEACVMLVTRGTNDPELIVVLVARPETAPALATEIRTTLPRLPAFELFSASALPRGSMGKIRRPEVAQAVADALDRPDGPRGALGLVPHGRA